MPSGAQVAAAAAAAAANATDAVHSVAAKPDNELSPIAVAKAAPDVAQAIENAIVATPEMQNILNVEPWWRKRSNWAAIASVGAAALAGVDYLARQNEVNLFTIGFAVWAGYAAWRAGHAVTPLGTTPTKLPYPLNRG